MFPLSLQWLKTEATEDESNVAGHWAQQLREILEDRVPPPSGKAAAKHQAAQWCVPAGPPAVLLESLWHGSVDSVPIITPSVPVTIVCEFEQLADHYDWYNNFALTSIFYACLPPAQAVPQPVASAPRHTCHS